MTTNQVILAATLCLPLLSAAAEPKTNTAVTVSYEGTYITQPDGKQVQKVVTIPCTNGLTIIRVIAAAGGYGTPPHHHIYLIRNGRSTLLPDPRHVEREQDVLQLQPGDRIEFKGLQNPVPKNTARKFTDPKH
ncbi:MAG: hypothetical protein PHR77_00260 [Kiritimatiellae bacterium]|nr:hypothetical protein [Kiritimatiellia bacterium]MDD5519813.1 hypothetical protein [Kiritimatiellia bacterium]